MAEDADVADEVFPEVVAAVLIIFIDDLHQKEWNDHRQVAKRKQRRPL